MEGMELDVLRPEESPPSGIGSLASPDRVMTDERRSCGDAKASLTRLRHYIRHTRVEIASRKCNFCLGCTSIFFVVVVAAVCYTILGQLPLVFLQQAENEEGQFDVMLSPRGGAPFLNYSKVSDVLAEQLSADYSFHSPRTYLAAYVYPSQCTQAVLAQGLSMDRPSEWVYQHRFSANTSCSSATECVLFACGEYMDTYVRDSLILVDTVKEQRMGFGRSFTTHTSIPFDAGSVVISRKTARALDVSAGDRVLVAVEMDSKSDPLLSSVVHRAASTLTSNTSLVDEYVRRVHPFSTVVLPVRIQAVLPDSQGKASESASSLTLMEATPFLPFATQHMHPNFTDSSDMQPVVEWVRQADLEHFSEFVFVNLPNTPASPRTDNFLTTDYDPVQQRMLHFSSTMLYYLGFPEADTNMPVLEFLRSVRFFQLWLGLILNTILTILFIISAMLLYSLLLISIETRTFELGVLRMLGMSRGRIVALLSVQAGFFSLPSWLIGLVVAQLLASLVLGVMEDIVDVPISRTLSLTALLVASFIGLFIPLVASVGPIRASLRANLHDSLDTQRSRTVAVKYSINRSEDATVSIPAMILGSVMFLAGFLIYYLLPWALLTANFGVVINFFFALLIGMLLGLILLSLNVQHLLERGLLLLFFFWEKRSLRTVVVKNLISHKIRNRKTSVMYSLSLGFILFITVAFNMQIQSARFQNLQGAGVYMYGVKDGGFSSDTVEKLESQAMADAAIDSFTWTTESVQGTENMDFESTRLSTLGHVYGHNVKIFGVSSNFFDVTLEEFLIENTHDTSSGLDLGKQLYTASGSQTALLSSYFMDDLQLTSLDTHYLFELFARASDVAADPSAGKQLHRMRPLAFLDSCPTFHLTKYPGSRDTSVLVSMHTFMRLSGALYESLEDVPLRGMLLRLSDQATDDDKDRVVKWLRRNQASTWDARDFEEGLQRTTDVMSIVFSVATYIALFLCLFSLTASMFSNIMDQTKEIGVLRSLGLTTRQVSRAYVYEAFIVVMSSSLMGMVIGTVVGFTMMLQNAVFTATPLNIDFPFATIPILGLVALVCAVLATWTPARMLAKRPIASVLRMVF